MFLEEIEFGVLASAGDCSNQDQRGRHVFGLVVAGFN